jgi:alpha-1,6-mannosyltransferase
VNSLERLTAKDAAAPRTGVDERAAFLRLALLGAAIVALTLATPFAFRAGGDHAYMGFAIATGLVALGATYVAEGTKATNALWLIVAIAALVRVVLLFTDPLLSTDIYRYIWDGRVQAAGINPYRYVPMDDALASLRDAAIYPHINRANYAVTIYPPVAQMFFFAVTRVGETVVTMKLALLACEAVTATLIVLLLRRLGRPATRIVAYLWHPLPIWEIANNGHVDALMIALMMLGLWVALAGRPLRGALSIALGALVKPFAVLALPAIWRPWDWRLPLVVLAAAVLCYLPYWSGGWGVFGFLPRYLHDEGLDTGANIWPLAAWRAIAGIWPGDLAIYVAIAALIIAALSLRAAFRQPRSIETSLADINRLLLAALLLLSPNYPWYFLVVTPLVALVGGAPLWALTIGAVLLQEEATWDPYVPLLIRKSILYGVFFLACAFVAWRAHRASPSPRVAGDERSDAR